MRNEYIKSPVTEAETIASIETFSELSDLPNVAGAIDGTHIEIKAPLESAVDYFSRYHQYDFIVQGVVNGQKLFLDFSAGFPGSLHDARVLRNSTLYRRAERDEVLNNPTARVGRCEIRPYLAIACAVLHNFCIRNDDDWDERDEDDRDDGEDDDRNIMQDGDNIREALKEYISSL